MIVRADDLPGGYLELGAFLRGAIHGPTAVVEDPCFLVVIPAERREAFLYSYPVLVLEVLSS
jgi:hypothetical protein